MNDLPEEQFHQQLNTKSAFMPSDARFLLYGLDNTPQVVAVEPSGTHEVTIYRRDEHRHTVSERRANTPWIISRTPQPYNDEADTDIIPLRGDHPFRYLITFASRASYNRAAERSRNSPNSVIGPFSLTGQFQIRTGLTMFKTMEFQDLRRMQLDLETLSLDPGTDDAGIIMIAIRQDSFETVLVHESTEAELLNRLSDIVAKLDPDVIEGHNILGFDVPYLIHRANHAGVELKLGRDGSAPRLLEGGRQHEP